MLIRHARPVCSCWAKSSEETQSPANKKPIRNPKQRRSWYSHERTTKDRLSNSLTKAVGQPIVRCAIYARYSSDLQRPTSIDDQVRNCRAAGERNGWTVLDDFIRSDSELTGRTLVGREGIADLARLAQTKPRPFDCIIIDDTSRLGRYLPDVLRECDLLTFNGVFVYFASDRIDSRDPSFRIAHLFKGYTDEQYIQGLREKVHRGQTGCVLKGYTQAAEPTDTATSI